MSTIHSRSTLSEQTGPATADRHISIRDGELCRAGKQQGNLSRGDCHYAVDADGARETSCVCGWLTRPSSSHTRAAARWRTAARGAGREWSGARALSLIRRRRSDGHSCLCMCPPSCTIPIQISMHPRPSVHGRQLPSEIGLHGQGMSPAATPSSSRTSRPRIMHSPDAKF